MVDLRLYEMIVVEWEEETAVTVEVLEMIDQPEVFVPDPGRIEAFVEAPVEWRHWEG
jgi:hypothetical protein